MQSLVHLLAEVGTAPSEDGQDEMELIIVEEEEEEEEEEGMQMQHTATMRTSMLDDDGNRLSGTKSGWGRGSQPSAGDGGHDNNRASLAVLKLPRLGRVGAANPHEYQDYVTALMDSRVIDGTMHVEEAGT